MSLPGRPKGEYRSAKHEVRIVRVAFAPFYADEQTRPSFLSSADPMFGQIADEIDTITRAAGLSARFERMHDRVVIS